MSGPNIGAARWVLEQDAYRFCHDPGYRLTHAEHRWCPVVRAGSDCPSLASACELPPIDEDGIGWFGRGSGRGYGEGAQRPPPPSTEIQIPSLGGVATLVFAVLLAVGVYFLVKAIRANLRGQATETPAEAAPEAEEPAPEKAAPGPVETDVARLLARARAAAARGDFDRALQDAYAALLRRLDGDGLIEIHPSRTNGDYVRDLRDKPDLKDAVRGIVRDVERVHFGAAPATAGLVASVLERVVPIASRASLVLALFLALGSTVACDDAGSAGIESADTSPSGTRAVLELLAGSGIDASLRRKPLSKIDETTETIVLLSEVELDANVWDTLLDWVETDGGTLVLAGISPPPARLDVRVAPSTMMRTRIGVARGFPSLGEPTLAAPTGPKLVARDDLEGLMPMLERGDDVYASHTYYGDGTILLFADRKLFTNIALGVADNASFLVELFTTYPGAVELCDRFTGAGADSPLDSVSQAKLTPLILQLFAVLALFVLWKGTRFALPREARSRSRRAFSDHVRALGLTYARAGASSHVLGIYAAWAIERLRERMHGGARRGLVPLAESIARRTGKPESEVMRVLVDAQTAGEDSAPPSFRHSSRHGAHAPAKSDNARAPLALMRELEAYLSITRKRDPRRAGPPGGSS